MIKERLAKLISVKSLVTLVLTIVFSIITLLGVVSAEMFLTVFTIIIGFYFGTQATKKDDTLTSDNSSQTAADEADQNKEIAAATEAVEDDVYDDDLDSEDDEDECDDSIG